MRRPRIIRALLLATTIAGTPTLAHADPGQLLQTAVTAAATAASFIPGVGPFLSAAIQIGGTLLTQALFGRASSSGGQREERTRKFDTHPNFQFAFGEFPVEGKVIFHYSEGQRYYLVYLLNSIPSADRCVYKIEINDGIELDIPGLATGPENADYNGVLVSQDAYDMDLGAGAEDPAPYGVSDAPDVKFWIGSGAHTQAPQQWLDEIGPGGSGVLKSTDTWSGATVAFVRLVDDNPKLRGQRYGHGKPPPLKFYGKWSKLYDPRLDPTSGVTQIGNTVLGKQDTPPGSPSDGDAYIVDATATGAWAGQENDVATWDAGASPPAWTFATPTNGDQYWVLDEGVQYTWDTSVSPSAWVAGQVAHDIDDRTTWEHSYNPALCALMLATHQFALGFDQEMIPIQQWADAADDCDNEYSTAAKTGGLAPANNRLELHFAADFTDDSPVGRVPASTTQVSISGGTARFDLTGANFEGIVYDDLEVSDLRPGGNEFDFSVKITPDALSPQPTMTILATAVSSTVKTYRWRVLASGALEFVAWASGASGQFDPPAINLTSAAGAVTPGVEQTVRVWRENDDWRMSVDGTVVASDLNNPVTLNTGSSDLMHFVVGRWENNNNPFTGYMDDLQIVINQVVADQVDEPWGCNGLVVIEDRELSLLTPVLDCMAGHLDTTDGLLGVRAGVWVSPTDSLTQPVSDEISVDGARDAGFDTVRAKFIWPGAEWEESDGPGYRLRAGNRVHPLHLPLVAAHEQAAKLEKIFALRAEPNRSVTAGFDGRELTRRIGERVNFSLSGFARASSSYVITGKTPVTRQADDGFEVSTGLTLAEDLEATYSWTGADYTVPGTFTNPAAVSPDVAEPSSVVAEQRNYVTGDGTTAEARLKITVTITEATSEYAQNIEVQVDDGGGYVTLAILSVIPGTTTYVTYADPALVGVTYTPRARVDGGGDLGASDWVVGNSVTIAAPTLDYDHSDYSAEFA